MATLPSVDDLLQTKDSEIAARRAFRYYSRKAFSAPNNRYYHEQRINASLLLNEKEPLQGAVADFLFGCWYDIPYDIEDIFSRIEGRLHPRIQQAFLNCIKKLEYIGQNSELATRWSVLITPSLNVQTHRLRVSSDDAKKIAENVIAELIVARKASDWERIKTVECEFFAHCLACNDRLAFSIVWFCLSKNEWPFDEFWFDCQQRLEQTNSTPSASLHSKKEMPKLSNDKLNT